MASLLNTPLQMIIRFHSFWKSSQGVKFVCVKSRTLSSTLYINRLVANCLNICHTTFVYKIMVSCYILVSLNDGIILALV